MTDKYERGAIEKIWEVLQIIKRQMIITGLTKIQFPYIEFEDIGLDDGIKILNRLEKIDKVIKITQNPQDFFDDEGQVEINYGSVAIIVIIKDKFDKFFSKIEKIYKGMAKEYQDDIETEEQEEKDEPIYKIKYQSQGCKILINNFLLSNPNFNSENEIIFDYIYRHPNQRISRQELEKKCLGEDDKFKKTLQQVVNSLGFKGDIKDVFFNVSEKGILFKNPIYRKDLEELGKKYLKFNEKELSPITSS